MRRPKGANLRKEKTRCSGLERHTRPARDLPQPGLKLVSMIYATQEYKMKVNPYLTFDGDCEGL
jgi:hypothetical protein